MVSFAPESIFRFGFINITNTIFGTILADLIFVAICYFISKNLKLIPGLFQNAIESLMEAFYNLTESIAYERAEKIFPYLMSFFLFIIISNYSGLIPGVGTIGFFEKGKFIPIFRSPTSDLNTTLGLAIVSTVATHVLSINVLGLKTYLSRYFSLNPINLYVGLLEIVGEFTKVVSLSFRLFGNIYAGEVVLTITAGIFAFLFPIPFLLLETVVGCVQALVFGMLTTAFMAVLTTPPHGAGEHE